MTDKTGIRRSKLVQVAEKDSSLVASVYLRTVSCHDTKHSLEWQRRKLHSFCRFPFYLISHLSKGLTERHAQLVDFFFYSVEDHG